MRTVQDSVYLRFRQKTSPKGGRPKAEAPKPRKMRDQWGAAKKGGARMVVPRRPHHSTVWIGCSDDIANVKEL